MATSEAAVATGGGDDGSGLYTSDFRWRRLPPALKVVYDQQGHRQEVIDGSTFWKFLVRCTASAGNASAPAAGDSASGAVGGGGSGSNELQGVSPQETFTDIDQLKVFLQQLAKNVGSGPPPDVFPLDSERRQGDAKPGNERRVIEIVGEGDEQRERFVDEDDDEYVTEEEEGVSLSGSDDEEAVARVAKPDAAAHAHPHQEEIDQLLRVFMQQQHERKRSFEKAEDEVDDGPHTGDGSALMMLDAMFKMMAGVPGEAPDPREVRLQEMVEKLRAEDKEQLADLLKKVTVKVPPPEIQQHLPKVVIAALDRFSAWRDRQRAERHFRHQERKARLLQYAKEVAEEEAALAAQK